MSTIVPQNFYVYTLTSSLTDTVFYVGKGKGSRVTSHEREARKGIQSHKCNTIRKIWQQGGEVIKQKVANFSTEQDAFIYEWCLINLIYGRESLTNVSDGGEGSSGYCFTDENRENTRQAVLRTWSDPNFREKRSHDTLERYTNPEEIERNRQIAKELWEDPTYLEKMAQRYTPEVLKKMSKARSQGDPNRVGTFEGFINPQGVVYSPVINLSAFCREHNLSYCGMWLVVKGKQASHQGWTRNYS